jgi:hypothetical protein
VEGGARSEFCRNRTNRNEKSGCRMHRGRLKSAWSKSSKKL